MAQCPRSCRYSCKPPPHARSLPTHADDPVAPARRVLARDRPVDEEHIQIGHGRNGVEFLECRARLDLHANKRLASIFGLLDRRPSRVVPVGTLRIHAAKATRGKPTPAHKLVGLLGAVDPRGHNALNTRFEVLAHQRRMRERHPDQTAKAIGPRGNRRHQILLGVSPECS